MRRIIVPVILALVVAALAATAAFAVDDTSFKMVRSQAAVDNECLKGAKANVDVRTAGTGLQIMDVELNHAPKNTEFELFVTQQPNSPFGISWYQADFETNNQGQGEVRAIGIFGEELFVFAPGSVNAPRWTNLTPRRTRSSTRCTPSIWGCGLATRRTPRMLAARTPSLSSMVTTKRASRRSAPAISPT
jgi:hypothetical protein